MPVPESDYIYVKADYFQCKERCCDLFRFIHFECFTAALQLCFESTLRVIYPANKLYDISIVNLKCYVCKQFVYEVGPDMLT